MVCAPARGPQGQHPTRCAGTGQTVAQPRPSSAERSRAASMAAMKAALTDDMMFKPLAFEYPDDRIAAHVEDQIMLGNEIMIAPVYTQNAIGRYVYLPEEMIFVKFLGDGTIHQEVLEKGIHYVEVALNEVPLFIRKGCAIPVADFAESVPEIDESTIQMIGYEGASYERYTDDGVSRI